MVMYEIDRRVEEGSKSRSGQTRSIKCNLQDFKMSR